MENFNISLKKEEVIAETTDKPVFSHTFESLASNNHISFRVDNVSCCDAKLFVVLDSVRKRDGRKYHDEFLAVALKDYRGGIVIERWDDCVEFKAMAIPQGLIDYLKGQL